MLTALSGVIAMGLCYAVAVAIAFCFPSKEMLDAEAVEREWTVEPEQAAEHEWTAP